MQPVLITGPKLKPYKANVTAVERRPAYTKPQKPEQTALQAIPACALSSEQTHKALVRKTKNTNIPLTLKALNERRTLAI